MWTNLTPAEADEYYAFMRRINEWTTYCAACRSAKPKIEIDYSRDLPDADHIRWDALAQKFWNTDQ